jgi:general stress protein CsbA
VSGGGGGDGMNVVLLFASITLGDLTFFFFVFFFIWGLVAGWTNGMVIYSKERDLRKHCGEIIFVREIPDDV